MRRLSILMLLVPMLCFVGCGDCKVAPPVTPTVAPDVQPEPQPEPVPTGNIEVLSFTAKWCPACQRDKPQIEAMRQEGIKVTVIDVDDHPELARKYGIRRLPTYIVLEDGVEIQRTGDIILILTIISAILKIVIPLLPLLL